MEALRRLNRNDIFSLVVYDHEVDSLIPAQSASLTEWMESRIHGIQPRENTALFGGVSQGAAELKKNMPNPYIHRLILLSDGLANVGPNSPADPARLGTGLLKEGISVSQDRALDLYNAGDAYERTKHHTHTLDLSPAAGCPMHEA